MDLKINAGTFVSVITPSTNDKNMKAFTNDIKKFEKKNIAVNKNVMDGANFSINVNYATQPLYMSGSYEKGDFKKITDILDHFAQQKGGSVEPTYRYKYQKYKNKYLELKGDL